MIKEMRAKGNTYPMIVFKVVRDKLFGGGILLNKGWDWNWKSVLIKRAERIKNNKIKSAIARQLRRNGYDKSWPEVEVKNGRWVVKDGFFYSDISDLLK